MIFKSLLKVILLTDSFKKPIVFRSNHASNAYVIGGTLPAEKERLLREISALKTNPEFCRPKEVRRF